MGKFLCFSINMIVAWGSIQGASFNERDDFGRTLLHQAVANENVEEVQRLIRAGAKVNARDYKGITPLHVAVKAKKPQIAKLLLQSGADLDLRECCQGKSPEEYLTTDVSSWDYYEMLALWRIATEASRLKRRAIAMCLHPRTGCQSLFQKLLPEAMSDALQCICHYLKPRFLIDDSEMSEMFKHQHELDKKFLSEAIDGYTASIPNRLARIKDLVLQGANVNARNKDGETFLHVFFRHDGLMEINYYGPDPRDYSLIPWLVSLGADINAQDRESLTPLHKAISRGLKEKMCELLKNGADVAQVLKCGQRVYSRYDYVEHKDLYRLLHVWPDAVESEKAVQQFELNNIFVEAARQCDIAKMKECLQKGVKIVAINDDGYTALEVIGQSCSETEKVEASVLFLLKSGFPLIQNRVKRNACSALKNKHCLTACGFIKNWSLMGFITCMLRHTFCLAMHPRLGKESFIGNKMPREVCQKICSYLEPSSFVIDQSVVAYYHDWYSRHRAVPWKHCSNCRSCLCQIPEFSKYVKAVLSNLQDLGLRGAELDAVIEKMAQQ